MAEIHLEPITADSSRQIQTRPGITFSSWTTPANPAFKFQELMDAAVADEADDPPIPEDDTASPLSSPLTSPPTSLSPLFSSPIPAPPRDLSPDLPSATKPPTHIPTKSQAAHTNLAADEISKASFRMKKRSHKNRTKRRQAEAHEMGHALHRKSVKRALHKHVMPSNPINTNHSIKKTDIASTAYVGVREQKPKIVHWRSW